MFAIEVASSSPHTQMDQHLRVFFDLAPVACGYHPCPTLTRPATFVAMGTGRASGSLRSNAKRQGESFQKPYGTQLASHYVSKNVPRNGN